MSLPRRMALAGVPTRPSRGWPVRGWLGRPGGGRSWPRPRSPRARFEDLSQLMLDRRHYSVARWDSMYGIPTNSAPVRRLSREPDQP
jgi:hypothetical protein